MRIPACLHARTSAPLFLHAHARMLACAMSQDQQPVVDELVEKLLAARKANAGVNNQRQVLFAKFDQYIHSQEKVDLAATFAEYAAKIQGIPVTPGTNFAASFGHLAGGYDAQYYGYLFSDVYAVDCYESQFKGDIFSPQAGMAYRTKILQPGGSKDGMDMLRDFLGREPDTTPFLRSKGLEA
eukprot:m.117856 g.117856  ORF g.117856 m.117856 type:complete len:183 (-) comp15553_c0_seq8:108-656(-)